jgi:hypothetical protein
MRTNRTTALPLALLLALELNVTPAVAEQGNPAEPPTGVQVTGGGKEAVRLVDWAVTQYESAGLSLPAINVRVHHDQAPCEGHLGLTYNTPDAATVHLCTPGNGRGIVDRLILVHELAHAWVAENVDAAGRDQFIGVHGLEAWWESANGWERQGVEWAAETIAWAVSDEDVRLIGEVDDDPAAIRRGYETLTGTAVSDTHLHDHSLAVRASTLGGQPAARRPDIDSLLALDPLTLDELAERWGTAVARHDLPTGLPDWIQRPDSVVVTAQLTAKVELIAVTDNSGTVKTVTVVGTESGQCESYDTLLAWVLLLETLQPDWADAIDAGSYDSALVQRHGRLRGIVHLP